VPGAGEGGACGIEAPAPVIGKALGLVDRRGKAANRDRNARQLTRPLRLNLGPGLFAALALEHADCAPVLRIEHSQNQGGLFVAMAAWSDRIGVEAGKDFVFKVIHFHGPPMTTIR
jgi:hypothetical protein